MDQGTFSLDCPNCNKELDIEVRGEKDSDPVIRINGRIVEKRKSVPLKFEKTPGKKIVKAAEISLREDLPYGRRMRVISILLILVAILGMVSSFSTIIGTFSIYDLEEKSPNSLVTLSVWIIDEGSGRALEGVNVTLTDGSVNFTGVSNDQGLAVIEDLVTGELEMEISKEGYKTVRSGITIKKGSPNVVDIPMERGDQTEEMPILVHQFRVKTYSRIITNVAATLMFLASLMALVSAFFVYRKEFFSLALFSAFLSLFSFGFLLGSVLAFIALVMMIFSYDGFSHTHTLIDMIERMRKEDLRTMLRSSDRKIPGLPPTRK
jgi:hypothetical protein